MTFQTKQHKIHLLVLEAVKLAVDDTPTGFSLPREPWIIYVSRAAKYVVGGVDLWDRMHVIDRDIVYKRCRNQYEGAIAKDSGNTPY